MTFKKIKDKFQYKIFRFILNNKSLLVLILLSLTTRLYGIVDKDLWFDEVLDINQSLKSAYTILTIGLLTPLHYLIIHAFSFISTDILFLRIPSVLFGIASVILFYAAIKKISSDKVAFLSALLLAISPMIIEFSQQILHYSYFVFFTIATLYFYFDLLLKPRFEIKDILLFVFFTVCNLTTHLSAGIVFIMQFIFLFGYYVVRYKLFILKLSIFWKQRQSKFLILGLLGIIAIMLYKFDYSLVISANGRINSNAPIPLGYSLVSQLKTEFLHRFDLQFFKAMFAWFGLGGGAYLSIYVTLGLFGLITLFKQNKAIFFFSITWMAGPFLILHILRMNHWFEEKYFIFIIPMYLYVVAEGVIKVIYLRVTKKRDLSFRLVLYISACIFFIIGSINPIKSRTTYGFQIKGDQQFSWKSAIDHAKSKMKKGDRIFAIDDKFLKVYLGNKTRNLLWFSEDDLIHYTPSQYSELVRAENDSYYLSIPDIYDMRVGTLITVEPQGLAGGFNTYRTRFVKNTPTTIDGTYTESFMKMTYLKDAYDWKNVYQTYISENNKGLPQTELDNVIFLAPKNSANSYIAYKFRLNPTFSQLLLKVVDLNTTQNTINIETKTTNGIVVQQNPISERKYRTYRERIFDLTQATYNSELDLTFKFKYEQPVPYNDLVSGLKSFTLTQSLASQPQFERNALNEYVYDAELETKKNPKWVTDTLENFGWVQTRFGILYRLSGDAYSGLVYKFAVPPNTNSGTLTTKTYTKDQSLEVLISNDNFHYDSLGKHTHELKEIEHSYPIESASILGQQYIYIKILTEQPNQFGALRNLKLILK